MKYFEKETFLILEETGDKIVDAYFKLNRIKENNMGYIDGYTLTESLEYYREAEEGIIAKFIAWIKRVIDAVLGRNDLSKQKLDPKTEIELNGDLDKKMKSFKSADSKLKKLLKVAGIAVTATTTAAAIGTAGYSIGKGDADKEYKRGKKDGERATTARTVPDTAARGITIGREFEKKLKEIDSIASDFEKDIKDIKDEKSKKTFTAADLESALNYLDKTVASMKTSADEKLKNATPEEISRIKLAINDYCNVVAKMKADLTSAYNAKVEREKKAEQAKKPKQITIRLDVDKKDMSQKSGIDIAKDLLRETAEYKDMMMELEAGLTFFEKNKSDFQSAMSECKSKVTSANFFDQRYPEPKKNIGEVLSHADKYFKQYEKFIKDEESRLNKDKEKFIKDTKLCEKEAKIIRRRTVRFIAIFNNITRFEKGLSKGIYAYVSDDRRNVIERMLDETKGEF